jgi:formyltetrahydrofolate synthetase
VLSKGIIATKISFNQTQIVKEVQIRLSSDCTEIICCNNEQYSDFVRMYFTFPRHYKFNKIIGFSYGADSYTFQHVRNKVLKMSEELLVEEIDFMLNEVRFSLPFNPDYNHKPFELS